MGHILAKRATFFFFHGLSLTPEGLVQVLVSGESPAGAARAVLPVGLKASPSSVGPALCLSLSSPARPCGGVFPCRELRVP